MADKDGGYAFPQSETKNQNTVAAEHGEGGMSLRDYFAGQSIVGILSGNYDPVVDRCTQLAFEIADAMLKERERHQAPAGVPSDPASAADR